MVSPWKMKTTYLKWHVQQNSIIKNRGHQTHFWVISTFKVKTKVAYNSFQLFSSDDTTIIVSLWRGFRASLNFWKFESESQPQTFLNFKKSCILSCLSHCHNKKWGSPSSFLNDKRLKIELRVLWSGCTIAMVT